MNEIGIIGAGVMGGNLAINFTTKGLRVSIYDRSPAAVESFASQAEAVPVSGHIDLNVFLSQLRTPRCIWLMINAGNPVDHLLSELVPHLDSGDIVVDGGNSHFSDTERRQAQLKQKGVRFLGVGVSGGAQGALRGPSMMVGGDFSAYTELQPWLYAAAAHTPSGTPCVAHFGSGGAGHYVKMVHNGIEYAQMQAIAEIYDFLHRLGGLSAEMLADLFETWNVHLHSYLLEITAQVLRAHDAESGKPLVDFVVDAAEQKGTGQWTVQEALQTCAPAMTIASALEARLASSFPSERQRTAALLPGPYPVITIIPELKEAAYSALWAALLTAYTQGFNLLRLSGQPRGYAPDLAAVARVWQSGCIIRSDLLQEIEQAFLQRPEISDLLTEGSFSESFAHCQSGWRQTVGLCVQHGLPVAVLSAALTHYDMARTLRLPTNLIQAQRDFFGAHTYARIDRPGVFHSDWESFAREVHLK